ncbi:uroporphyrinogen-III C-methyltransferase [Psychromonas ossibalaenae]|uniref:uroporphyrinogen-III C-methyltransferase n=1 Tax=Psychromonas ossibalaenae TaxID=444922 RepID=UPI00036B35BE|nr:uroporphyrinogen-III C-methyltransferase [Psychromonas ossibalaenae]
MGFKKTTSALSSSITADTETTNIAPIHAAQKRAPGTVYLVGAGPGDADLLTIKALSLIQQCDVIVFDNLVSKEIRSLFPEQALSVYAGKSKSAHHFTQTQINQLLAGKARQGLTVCRLKGGDAFVFGRGGEEMTALKKQGIQVEIVPGITAAAGCSSYAGIPLTHRGLSQGCTFVTAHAEKQLDINWSALAALDHTLVFYMGLSKAGLIEKQLTAAGLSKDTPIALIENGCCPEQRLITGTLTQLASLVTKEQVKSPALIMVGKVVSLAQRLQWFNGQSHIDNVVNELRRLSA